MADTFGNDNYEESVYKPIVTRTYNRERGRCRYSIEITNGS